MAVKDILLVLTTYPEPTPVSAVSEAIDFAAAIGARISAIACEVKIRVPGNILANALLDIPGMVAAEAKKSATNAEVASGGVSGLRREAGSVPRADTGALSDVGGSRRARRICPTPGPYDCAGA